MRGTCAKVVSQVGVPTYAPPRPDSVGIGGAGNCHYDTECGIGFRCEKQSGVTGNCMR
jgi:hypothetical protein